MDPARVLCLGILVADIFVPPLERLPAAGELMATDDFLVQPGGCAANVSLGLRALGVRSAVCGRVGDDHFGELLIGELRERGVGTDDVRRTAGRSTSTTVILPVTGDDRRYVHSFGANALFSGDDLAQVALERASVLYVGGYLMLPSMHQRSLAEQLQRARAHGTVVVLDVAVPAGSAASLDALETLLPLADYFVPNIDEARAITGESDPHRQAQRLMACGAQRVLIKLGDRGTYVRSAQESFEMPAPHVEAIEPSGAGDAFAAGLIVGILEQWGLEDMVRFANVVGSSACTALGAWNGVFSREQADAYLAAHPLEPVTGAAVSISS
jgi:sugar/nucleoside kinase (ribokinase family)